MKTRIILIPILVLCMSIYAIGYSPPTITWEVKTVDLGKIPKSKPATARFSFENTGNGPLILTRVKGSCGCTVTEYTKGEIQKGEFGMVTATYNAAKAGVFNKTVSVSSNAGETPIILRLKGEVVE